MSSPTLSTYLVFDGQCGAAFDFYRAVFGGAFSARQTFADAPPSEHMPPDAADRVMHVSLPVGESVLMGSDTPGPHEPVGAPAGFAIAYAPASRADADETFAKLAEGGVIQMPLAETFWGAYFGMCVDKFGVTWMVNLELAQS